MPEPEPVALGEVRRTTVAGDAAGLIEALRNRSIDDALQQVGGAVQTVYLAEPSDRRDALAPYVLTIAQRLGMRAWEGDEILADQLLRLLSGKPADGTSLRVDLDELTDALSHSGEEEGAYVDRTTGEVVPAFVTNEGTVGEDDAIDVEGEQWLYLDREQSEWQDMADFAASVTEPDVRRALEHAIHGKGGFSRFRSAVHEHDVNRRWQVYSSDRVWGRAREVLLTHGIRAV
ncbi:UPF0158 family protein [Luteipulveratus mongoliensis]|uniref:UPF0158 family protein n=1 Tax=Luteipulveratus mongoliensis TaxID=571913 RepID=UPI000696915C|nr:UPF0158 family protein [Luteipulveratus mongoliensis]